MSKASLFAIVIIVAVACTSKQSETSSTEAEVPELPEVDKRWANPDDSLILITFYQKSGGTNWKNK